MMKDADYWTRRIEADKMPWYDIVKAIQADSYRAGQGAMRERAARESLAWYRHERVGVTIDEAIRALPPEQLK